MAERLVSLDALRGLAVLFMLEVHLGFWWSKGLPEGDPLVGLGTMLGGMAAPVFFVVAGASLSLSSGSRPDGFLTRSARRGAALLVAGIVFTFLESAVYGPLGWGVLQCIGVSVILCAAVMKAGPWARALAGIALMALAPILRAALGIPPVLFSAQMMGVSSPAGYATSALLSGFFPLVPWTGFMLVGTAAGDWLFARVPGAGGRVLGDEGKNDGSQRAPPMRLAPAFSLAGFLILAGAAGAASGMPLEFFPPSLPFSFLASGICAAALAVLCLPWGRQAPAAVAGPLASLGRLSLTLFVAHHFIGYNAFLAAGSLNSFEIPVALAMVLVSWALAIAVAALWERKGFICSLEWLVGRLEGRPSK